MHPATNELPMPWVPGASVHPGTKAWVPFGDTRGNGQRFTSKPIWPRMPFPVRPSPMREAAKPSWAMRPTKSSLAFVKPKPLMPKNFLGSAREILGSWRAPLGRSVSSSSSAMNLPCKPRDVDVSCLGKDAMCGVKAGHDVWGQDRSNRRRPCPAFADLLNVEEHEESGKSTNRPCSCKT